MSNDERDGSLAFMNTMNTLEVIYDLKHVLYLSSHSLTHFPEIF